MAETTVHLDGTHSVVTPEYVEFKFVLAGTLSRFLAWAIDTVVAFMVALVIIIGLSMVMAAFPGFASAMVFVIWFLIDWGYSIFFETLWSGQTIGKKVMGLRVIQESGVRIGFYQSVLRNLARPLDRLPAFYLIGGIAILISKSQQRLGDMLAGTIVVRERQLKIPAALEKPDGDISLLQEPEFRTRVSKLTAEEEALLFSAAIRREEMGIEARLNLFSTLSKRLQEENGFYLPEHLSDEKLVLLVTAALAARNAERNRSTAGLGKRFASR